MDTNSMAVQIFDCKEFGKVRYQIINNEVFFCGKDVCDILQYGNHKDALQRHCKKNGVVKTDLIDSMGRNQETTFISEPNLYRLIVSSKMPKAQEFEELVFEEVLPSIRKKGYYITGKTTILPI